LAGGAGHPVVTGGRRRWALALGAAVLVVLLVGGRWLALETAERAWATAITGSDVHAAARDMARLVRGLILLTAVAWGTGNLLFVYRAIGSVQLPRRLGDLEIVEAVPHRVLLAGTIASGLLFGSVLTLGTGDWWMHAVLASHPPRFGMSDPLLHRDLGYYVGELPWARRAQGFVLLATVTVVVIVALLYVGIGSLRVRRWHPYASAHARAHLGVLLACAALALTWGAVLDPAETVAGLHGALDRSALHIRLPGAPIVAALAVTASVASLVWALREKPTLLVASWGALLGAEFLVYLVVPALVRARGPEAPNAALAREQERLERLAFGVEWLEDRPPPGFPTAAAAVAALPLWDPERVAAAVAQRRPDLLGGEREQEGPRPDVAGVSLAGSPLLPRSGARSGGLGSAMWLLAPLADLGAVANSRPPPAPAPAARWADIHRGPWARAGRPVAMVEADSGLAFAPVPTRDSAAWFGPGFQDFAVTAPDSWPATRAAGIPLTGWWRRTALAWSLQSPELARAETDGLLLLWRRDVVERFRRLAPFATFDAAAPLVADGALWWVAYGYLTSEVFPLARRMEWQGRSVRYVRAGLVGAVNAASGETRLYLAPGADSLAATWARAFRPVVRPLDSLPAALRSQLRYPAQAFRVAAALVAQSRADAGSWTARPREPFELTAPGLDGAGDARVWMAQGFETGKGAEFAGLLAGTMTATGPRLLLWRPQPPVRLPGLLVGSADDAPGVPRFWTVGGRLFSQQAKFAQRATEGAPRGLKEVYVNWGERAGVGPTPGAALEDLLVSGGVRSFGDTSLAARWAEARRLAAQADAALAAGDLEAFGRYYKQLTELLELGRRTLAPTIGPR
jgi:hypothetical protein